ncbi:MAG: radical SAM protein, partial [bacterium]
MSKMLFWSDYVQKIPLLGPIFKNHYFTLKRYYVNLLRKTSIRPGPIYVNWIATNRCNSRCVYCEASANQVKFEELTTDQIFRVVNELGELKVKQFFVIGGEPLIRKDVFEVLDYARKQGMKVGIFTNSLLYKKFKKEIKHAGLQNIWTSIDGMEKTHNENRGYPGAYEITMEAMQYYASINIPLRVINTVVHNRNFDELPELFEQVKRSGANWWRLGAVLPVGRAKDHQFGLSAERTLRLFQYIEKTRKLFNVTISEEMGY